MLLGEVLAGTKHETVAVATVLANSFPFQFNDVFSTVRDIRPRWHGEKFDLGKMLYSGEECSIESMVAPALTTAPLRGKTKSRVRFQLGTGGRDIVADLLGLIVTYALGASAAMLDRAAMLGWPRVLNLGFGADRLGPLAAPFQLGTDEGGPIAVPFQLTYGMDIVGT